jgi:hypothetical protein
MTGHWQRIQIWAGGDVAPAHCVDLGHITERCSEAWGADLGKTVELCKGKGAHILERLSNKVI